MIELIHGDCLAELPKLEANSVDTCITDPPYGLSFMGKDWDHGVPGVRFWREVLRVLKPGAMLLAFGGTRTHHRLMVAIEDAGFEIRDCIFWVFGSGFPKSHDIGKAIDKAAGAVGEHGDYKSKDHAIKRKPGNQRMHEGYQRPWRDDPEIEDRNARQYLPATDAAKLWDGWGTALKPAAEVIVLAMKPRDGTFAQNALKWGVAGLNVDGARVETNGESPTGSGSNQGWCISGSGNGGNVTPASGRWPANLIHDAGEEVMALFPQSKSGALKGSYKGSGQNSNCYGKYGMAEKDFAASTGSAARFFYCAKASRSERNAGCEELEEREAGAYGEFAGDGRGRQTEHAPRANNHPTVKPLALMRYLCRLTATPTGGIVLDPFMGSGSTGCAAVMEGRDFIGIDLDADYVEIARRRIAYWQGVAAEQAAAPEQLPMAL